MRTLLLLIFFWIILPLQIAFAQNSSIPSTPGIPGGGLNPNAIQSPYSALTAGFSHAYNNTACGLNCVYGSVLVTNRYTSTAGQGNPANIVISGLPASCYNIDKAYIWYITSYTEMSPPSSTVAVTNPIPTTATYTSVMVQSGPPKCWSETGTATYRTDVTAAVNGNGTYKFNINGFTSPNDEIDGIVFMIIYRDLSATYQGNLIIDDGCIVNGGSTTTTTDSLTGFTACAAGTNAHAFLFATDMQSNCNNGHHTTTLNGVTGTFSNSFLIFNDTVTTVTSGQTIAPFATSDPTDCYAWGLIGLYFQTHCAACTSSPITLTTSSTPAVCGNTNGSATVTASGGATPYTYSWSPSGGTGSTASNLGAGTYTVTVHDANHCSQTATVTVTNTGGVTAAINNPTMVSCHGQNNGSATVTVTGGTAPYSYSWSPSGGTGSTANGLSPGNYTVSVRDVNGCNSSVSVTITQPAAMTISMTHTNAGCYGGSNGSVTASVSGGTGTYTYSWNPGAATTASVSNLSTGTYTLTVKDANGCTQTDTVGVHQPAQLAVSIVPFSPSCSGANTCSANANVSGGTGPFTYTWSPSGGSNSSATGLAPGTYTVIVTDANGCTARDSSTLTQPTAITLTTSSVAAHCNLPDGIASVSVSGGSPGYTYSWSPGSCTSSRYNNIVPGNYSVIVTDSHGCRDTARVTVGNIPGVHISIPQASNPSCFGGSNGSANAFVSGGTGPFTFSWTPNPGTGQGTPHAYGLSAGRFICMVTDSTGCRDTASVLITQPPHLVVAAMHCLIICSGGCTPLNATATGGTPGYNYAWTNGSTPVTSPVCPATTTTYTVTATDTLGCVSTPDTVTIKVSTALLLTVSPSVSICSGQSTTLLATASGGGGQYTYSWTPSTGLNNPGIRNPVAMPFATTTYTVILTDNCGTHPDTAVVHVRVMPLPVGSITANRVTGCSPLCVTFTGSSTPGCNTMTWNFGDGGTAHGCGTVTHCYQTPGTFTVGTHFTDSSGCQASFTRVNFITVYPQPKASFTASPQPTNIYNPTIQFTDHSTNTTNWFWNFGDLNNAGSILENPAYAYPDTGCFVVRLTVMNTYGCRDSTEGRICIDPDFEFFAPNAFTPNGDGKNDEFLPLGTGLDISRYDLYIFDRWGNMLFHTNVWGQGWDGRANGGAKIAEIDTYVWKAKVYDFAGNKHEYIGDVNLIR